MWEGETNITYTPSKIRGTGCIYEQRVPGRDQGQDAHRPDISATGVCGRAACWGKYEPDRYPCITAVCESTQILNNLECSFKQNGKSKIHCLHIIKIHSANLVISKRFVVLIRITINQNQHFISHIKNIYHRILLFKLYNHHYKSILSSYYGI